MHTRHCVCVSSSASDAFRVGHHSIVNGTHQCDSHNFCGASGSKKSSHDCFKARALLRLLLLAEMQLAFVH